MTPDEPRAAPPLTVLVVEDDQRILDYRSKMLAHRGCVVRAASSYSEAIRELESGPAIDLAIIDIKLGDNPEDRSGIELAKRIKALHASTPVLAYSAYFRSADLSAADTSKIDQVIAKGAVRADELGDVLDQMIELARERKSES